MRPRARDTMVVSRVGLAVLHVNVAVNNLANIYFGNQAFQLSYLYKLYMVIICVDNPLIFLPS